MLSSTFAMAIVAVLFQNCAAAPPPDLSQLNQSSTAAPSGGAPAPLANAPVVSPPQPTPNPVAAPVSTPTPIATPVATPAPTPVPAAQSFSCRVTMFIGSTSGTGYSGGYYGSTSTSFSSKNYYPTSCSYACTGSGTYNTAASNPTTCHANPIGVVGTETGTQTGSAIRINRPFSNCAVTQELRQVSQSSGGLILQGDSICN